MMRPPAVGVHGRHRSLGAPGPLGWNDHGDPCHATQVGSTPGSLGVNDHGTPLPGSPTLLSPDRRRDIEAHINLIVEEANSAAHSQLEQKLQACLAAMQNRGGMDQSQTEVVRCAEAYFYGRLHALQGKGAVTGETDAQASSGNALRTGGVEYRTAGAFFQPLGSQQSGTAFGLSYERIGQTLPGHEAALGARDSTADWIERGTQDGLRDRSDGSGTLRRYASVT